MQLGRDWKDVKKMAGRYKKASKLSEKHKTLALEEWNALYVAVDPPDAEATRARAGLLPAVGP